MDEYEKINWWDFIGAEQRSKWYQEFASIVRVTVAANPRVADARRMGNMALQMMFSVYVTLGVFLMLAARNPQANRSLIAFAAWSSLVHAATMVVQVYFKVIKEQELIGVVVFAIVGLLLIFLGPAKMNGDPAA